MKLLLTLSPVQLFTFLLLAIIGIALCFTWSVFWFSIRQEKDRIRVVNSSYFLNNLTVIGVLISVTLITLSDQGNATATIPVLSGIIGYVLGNKNKKNKERKEDVDARKN